MRCDIGSITIFHLISPCRFVPSIAPEDYMEVSNLTLTFKPNMSTISVPVTIMNDGILEGDQSFFANLSSPVGPVTLRQDAQDRKSL